MKASSKEALGEEGEEVEEQAFLTHHEHTHRRIRKRRPWTAAQVARIVLEAAMACVIALLLLRPSFSHGLSPFRKSPVPQFPRKPYTFQSNPRYTPLDMFTNRSTTLHALHNWIELSSASRGYIVAPTDGNYDLPTPYTIAYDRYASGPGYMVSMFHQLHCLSYLAVRFQEGYDGVPLKDEVAHHTVHCLNYLRQGIMCSADVTLEGKTEAGPGEGSVHECVDYEAVVGWADERAGMRWREGLMPEEGTLA